MKKLLLSALLAVTAAAQFPTDSRGVIITGLPAAQDNLLGPLVPYGNSPWPYGDFMEKAVLDNMPVNALAEAPALGTALSGTVSWTSGSNTITTTANLTTALSGVGYVALAWTSVDGAGTGRAICPINSVTSTTITCAGGVFAPTSSGVTAYVLSSTPGPSGFTFLGWAPQSQPSTTWNYYDNAIGLYRFYYRTNNTTYLTDARAYADIQWQWALDHGYSFPVPRAASMVSQFFRALDGQSARFPGLYNEISRLVTAWADVTGSPTVDNRESGYVLWDIALGAKTDTDPTRHTQYCSWLSTYTTQWNSVQSADGSWGENEYGLNVSFAAAPKSFTPPFVYMGAPWREAINVKAMEAAYESLDDTSAQGCNTPTLAASTLTAVTNAVTWQHNYGRDTTNRGAFYEVNSQSNDQSTVFRPAGTVSITRTSTALTGVGTGWQTAGYCDGAHFIGIEGTPPTVYKIASCTSDTAAILSVAYGLYSESSDPSGVRYSIAPAASTSCGGSLATYCFIGAGDRNLTRTICGATGWLYAKTLNSTYLGWADECTSATLGGPAAGPTNSDNIGSVSLPCSGPACDGMIEDTGVGMKSCVATSNVPPCQNFTQIGNLGKNYGEAFGAPGIDNELAYRLFGLGIGSAKHPVSGKGAVSSKALH